MGASTHQYPPAFVTRMRNRFAFAAWLPALALSTLPACSNMEPNVIDKPVAGYDLVDLSRVDQAKYEKDYADCAAIANQDGTSVTKMAGKTMGVAADRVSMGVLGFKGDKDADRATVLKRCLTGRGYNVLR
jgi:hypothetical protein